MTAPTQLPEHQRTAPARIWLHDGDDEHTQPFPADMWSEGTTWSSDNATGRGVPYVRADLPTAGPQPGCLDDPRLQELFSVTIDGALTSGYQGAAPAPVGHWLEAWWQRGRAVAEREAALAGRVQAGEPVYDRSVVARIATQMGWTPPAAPGTPLDRWIRVGAIRSILVEALRDVTGAPDLAGNGLYLVDEAERVAIAAADMAPDDAPSPAHVADIRDGQLVWHLPTPADAVDPALLRGTHALYTGAAHRAAHQMPEVPAQPSGNSGEFELTRFCPGCGSVGPVPDTFRDCCPDGIRARMIPEPLAEQCRDLFRLALGAAAQSQPLSDAALDDMRSRSHLDFVTVREFRRVARSVERAHGIGCVGGGDANG